MQITHFSMEIKGSGTREVNILSYVTTPGNATFIQQPHQTHMYF
jgi:hypothetical protein